MKKYLSTILIITALGWVLSLPLIVKADDITSSVTVGNQAPAFDTDGTCGAYPCENPARYTTSPVNVGTSTTFRATGNDPNSENYYLIVCKTDVFNENNSGAPTCDTDQTICVSTSTADGVAATCNYNALSGDAEEQAWYARVCDANTVDQMCSSSSQGNTGQNEATPLVVNHAVTVTSVSNDSEVGSPNDPGVDVVWSSVADDPDNTSADTIDLHVCSTNSFNGTACAATTYCTQTGQSSNPTCSYQIPAGTDDDASPYVAYAFIIDNHDFNPSVSSQSDFYVANVAPSILSISTNGGNLISLTGGEYPSTTTISFSAFYRDTNGTRYCLVT